MKYLGNTLQICTAWMVVSKLWLCSYGDTQQWQVHKIARDNMSIKWLDSLFVNYKKFVKRLCSTADATVHLAANRTPLFAGRRFSFSCCIRHFS